MTQKNLTSYVNAPLFEKIKDYVHLSFDDMTIDFVIKWIGKLVAFEQIYQKYFVKIDFFFFWQIPYNNAMSYPEKGDELV